MTSISLPLEPVRAAASEMSVGHHRHEHCRVTKQQPHFQMFAPLFGQRRLAAEPSALSSRLKVPGSISP